MLHILPTNGGGVSAIVVAVLAGMAMPITALQILWINMVTETTLSITLAFEKAESRVMQRPPRDPREPLLSGYLVWRIVLVSALLFAGTMGMFLWETARGSEIDTARAAAVNALVAGEIAYLFSARFLQASSLSWGRLTGNRWVLVASAVRIVLQLGFTYAAPMQTLFGVAPRTRVHGLHRRVRSDGVLHRRTGESRLAGRASGGRGGGGAGARVGAAERVDTRGGVINRI